MRSVNWEGEHLWLYLRALGFDQKTAGSGVQVGPTMFKKPNASAFYIIVCFLFAKLDKLRAAKVFNGPKFIQLMYQFARHAVLEDMKRNSIGTDIPFAEAVKLTPKGVNMASARCRVASNKLLQILQKENLVIQEYKKKEQLLIKEIKQIKSEYEVLQLKSFKMKQNDQNKNDKTERIQKVRSMWTVIMEIITSLTKEKEAVDYVLQGCVEQYVLDGASVVFRIPQLLAHRVESDVHQQLDLLRASPPHSFHPSEDDDDDDSMFYQCLLSVSDIYNSFHEVRNEKVSDASSSVMDVATTASGWSATTASGWSATTASGWSATTASGWISSVPSELSKACENRDTLIEKNLPIEACKREKMPEPPKILNGKDDSAISEVSENTGDHVAQTESPVKKEDPLKESSEELAEEVRKSYF
ncbi:haus augmin-like complex subunit 6 [Limosa lapponica baueri]|uniref:Haus augmin-like complex subunit 6 n=1 Tax=Limosa lapponica baueri TaxID=1758121 RepID=A0A2I0TPU0_LIMLA|nr:haus augmin-like complex subunit 6 [Limosa lapponica baueri]